MAAFTDYVEQRVIDYWLRGNAEFSFSSPAAVYLALFTTATGDDGTGTEVSGGAYTRKQISFSAMTGVTNGRTSNTTDIEFPQATADWGTVTHVAVYDASTAGNMLFHGALTTSEVVQTGDILRFTTGDLGITLA